MLHDPISETTGCILSRTPCMTVDDVGQRGNRSWGSVRVVDSWPSKRRSTLLCSYHAISCCPLESGPRASSFLASFTVCKLYLHLSRDALSPCIAVFLVSQLWIESSVEYDRSGSGHVFLLRIEIEREERNHFARMNISTPCISTRSAGNAGFRHNSDAPRKLHREHGASVCFAKIPLDGMNP